jgi:hypothetical protein
MKDIKAILEVISQGRIVGSGGRAFRTSSSSNASRTDTPGRHDHGVDVGASRNDALEKAAKKRADDRTAERLRKIEKRNKEAEKRQKEVSKMANEEAIEEAKGRWVQDKPMKVHVAAMEKRDTADLKGMHDRWSGDHKDKKSDPSTSERLLAVHHVLKKRGETVSDLPQHRNLGMMRFHEETNTEKRMKLKNVARPGDADPKSEKSTLAKTGSITTKILDEGKPLMSDKNFGLSSSLIAAARQIVEKKQEDNGDARKMEGGKTPVILNPETDDKINENEPKKKHTMPKTAKDKKLAALAHPKDKITHKDVLVGRGVVKEEEVEEITETDHREFGAKGKMHPDMAKGMKVGRNVDFYARGSGDKTYGEVTKNDGKSVHLNVKGKTHKFSVSSNLGEEIEEVEEKTLYGTPSEYKRQLDMIAKKEKSLPSGISPERKALAIKKQKIQKLHKSSMGMKEDVELSAEELERIEAIAAQLDEAKPTIVSSPIRGANQDQSGHGTKSNVADYTISDSAKYSNTNGKLTTKKMHKEEVELEEGRGRPRKNPLPPGKEAEGDDTHKHPMQQLEKISHAIEGNEPHFEHKDGSKSKVGKHLAKHIVAIHNSMRTSQEKDNFAQKVHANRESMRAEVSKHF